MNFGIFWKFYSWESGFTDQLKWFRNKTHMHVPLFCCGIFRIKWCSIQCRSEYDRLWIDWSAIISDMISESFRCFWYPLNPFKTEFKPNQSKIGRSDSDLQLYSWESQHENHFWTDSFQIEITFELNQLENCLIQTLFQSLNFSWWWLMQMTNKYFKYS